MLNPILLKIRVNNPLEIWGSVIKLTRVFVLSWLPVLASFATIANVSKPARNQQPTAEAGREREGLERSRLADFKRAPSSKNSVPAFLLVSSSALSPAFCRNPQGLVLRLSSLGYWMLVFSLEFASWPGGLAADLRSRAAMLSGLQFWLLRGRFLSGYLSLPFARLSSGGGRAVKFSGLLLAESCPLHQNGKDSVVVFYRVALLGVMVLVPIIKACKPDSKLRMSINEKLIGSFDSDFLSAGLAVNKSQVFFVAVIKPLLK